jgi:hypothetical protein
MCCARWNIDPIDPSESSMSGRTDLANLYTRVVGVQAECALMQIRRQAATLLRMTTDSERRVRLAEVLRWHCLTPIFGAHHYFAGCADGGGDNKAFHQQDWTKQVGGQKYAGLKHEVEARYQRAAKGDEAKAKAAEDKATKAVATLTSAQRQELEDLQGRLKEENLRLADQIMKATQGSKEWKALTKELGTRVTEWQIIKAHLARADAAANSAPAAQATKAEPVALTKAPSVRYGAIGKKAYAGYAQSKIEDHFGPNAPQSAKDARAQMWQISEKSIAKHNADGSLDLLSDPTQNVTSLDGGVINPQKTGYSSSNLRMQELHSRLQEIRGLCNVLSLTRYANQTPVFGAGAVDSQHATDK